MNLIRYKINQIIPINKSLKLDINNLEIEYYNKKVDFFIALNKKISNYDIQMNASIITKRIEVLFKKNSKFYVELLLMHRSIQENNYFLEFKIKTLEDINYFYNKFKLQQGNNT